MAMHLPHDPLMLNCLTALLFPFPPAPRGSFWAPSPHAHPASYEEDEDSCGEPQDCYG